jgi:predicted AAA+ superfamily ATPase
MNSLEARIAAVFAFTASRGLKFVIVIDDLSFESTDDSFAALKAPPEGAVESRPPDTAVYYAVSKRRRLAKERHSERPGPGWRRAGYVIRPKLAPGMNKRRLFVKGERPPG